jgi:SM-20-related protein
MTGPRISVVDNFLGPNEQKAVWEFLRSPGWAFGAYSDEEDGASRYLYKHFSGYRKDTTEPFDPAASEAELRTASPLIASVWDRLRAGPLQGHVLARCYANGMPSGTEGGLHLDSNIDTHMTVIYYPHLAWSPNFGGETLFFDMNRSDIVAAVYPKPNRIVAFSGTIPHVARPTSRRCTDLRITLMFKTMPEGDVPGDPPRQAAG